MQSSLPILTVALSMLAGVGILAMAVLKGWSGWLGLKHAQLALRPDPQSASPAARIEIADLKERIRKLEAIAAGVDI